MSYQPGIAWKGNANGRPKLGSALAQFVRGKTKQGKKLMQFYLDVMDDVEQPMHIRLMACTRLEERAFGKAPMVIEENKTVQHSFIMILDRPKNGDDSKSTRMIEIFRTPGQERITEAEVSPEFVGPPKPE